MKHSSYAILFAAMVAVAVPAQQTGRSSQRAQTSKIKADRFQQFRYRLAFSEQGQYVAGFMEFHAKDDHTSGSGRNHPSDQMRGREKYESITLERGVTNDSSFAQWAGRGQGGHSKDLVIDIFNEAGQKSSTMKLSRCVAEEFQSTPDLDGSANRLSLRVLQLHCVGMTH